MTSSKKKRKFEIKSCKLNTFMTGLAKKARNSFPVLLKLRQKVAILMSIYYKA